MKKTVAVEVAGGSRVRLRGALDERWSVFASEGVFKVSVTIPEVGEPLESKLPQLREQLREVARGLVPRAQATGSDLPMAVLADQALQELADLEFLVRIQRDYIREHIEKKEG